MFPRQTETHSLGVSRCLEQSKWRMDRKRGEGEGRSIDDMAESETMIIGQLQWGKLRDGNQRCQESCI